MTIAEIIDFLGKYGPGAIFALGWYLERGERIDAQKEVKIIARDSIAAITSLEKQFEKWTEIFNRLRAQ